MSLFDRECSNCGLVEIDLFESFDAPEYIRCPECGSFLFRKRPCAPSVICISGEGTSALEFCNELDKRRANAAAGHGNTSFKD